MEKERYKEMIEDLKKEGKYKKPKLASEALNEYLKNKSKKISEVMPSNKVLKKKMVSRQVLKKNSMVVNVPEFKAPSILGDENRFFKGEMNKEKRSLYFS